MKRIEHKALSKFLVAGAAFLALSACGKTKFNPTDSEIQAAGPGSFTIPAKVDIILAEDDTGSISEAYDEIAAQVPGFLRSLEQSGWDYHFVNVPLTTDRAITQALASHHDSNWGSSWTPAYPGQPSNDPGMLIPSIFRTTDNFTGMISRGDVDYSNSKYAIEPGFETLKKAIQTRATGKHLLRSDALLVLMVISTGNDSSGVTYCDRGDGVKIPCANSDTSSYTSYYNTFKALRPAGRVKFYAAVAQGEKSCLGEAQTFDGTRYQRMAANLNGKFYNVCQQNISSIFSSLTDDLAATRINLRTKYLFMAKQPKVETIRVYKNGTLLPHDQNNGWTYAGYVNNVYTIDSPTPMNQASGYAIELHGTAKLLGNDAGSITFEPYGVQGSAG